MNELDTPRLELSDDELGVAVEESLYDLYRATARLPGGELDELPGYLRHHAFPSNPMFKGIWGARLAPEDVPLVAEEALAWHRERAAPFVFWTSGPTTTPEDLAPLLEPHGFQPWELGAPGPGRRARRARLERARSCSRRLSRRARCR